MGALTAGLLLTLTACSGDDDQPFTGTTVDNPYQVADVTLTDSDGEPYSLVADTDKRLTMVFFGYTRCFDGVCPAVLNNLALALVKLDDADRDDVDVVMVSTDPTYDTPEVLKYYMDRIDPSFIGLTGDFDDILTVSKSLVAGVDKTDPGGHTTYIMGLDSDDEAPVVWGQDTSPSQFARDIHTLLES